MKNSKLYHTLPTLRAVRRRARRSQKFFQKLAPKGFKVVAVLRDDDGVSIFKSRRWRNRIMTNDRKKLYEAYLQQSQPIGTQDAPHASQCEDGREDCTMDI